MTRLAKLCRGLPLAALAALAIAASAEAGTITAASGPVRVNGQSVTVDPAKPLTLAPNDRLETGSSTVTYKSDAGDQIVFESDSVAIEQVTTDQGSGIFLSKGAATATLSEKTLLGVSSGWVNAPQGGRTKVLVEAAAGREDREALFRAVEGSAWIRYAGDRFAVALMPAHTVTLEIEPGQLGTLMYRTGQQNAGEVEVHKRAPGGDIIASVPKATTGLFTDDADDKTKICNDINSLKTAKIRLRTRFAGKAENSAAIGPGTCALVDNATGAIDVLFQAVKFEILERAISLTTEFATLAQSNFSDVR